jgi:hypothetical protein
VATLDDADASAKGGAKRKLAHERGEGGGDRCVDGVPTLA